MKAALTLKSDFATRWATASPTPALRCPAALINLFMLLIHDAGVPGHLLEWHGHNDFHKAMINATTAWLYGCSAANSTLLGMGERTGNPPIEGLIIEYIALRGRNGIDTTVITDIAEYFEKEIGVKIPHNYPFVGSGFNVTSAGVHADGLIKCEEIYNIFDTRKFKTTDHHDHHGQVRQCRHRFLDQSAF